MEILNGESWKIRELSQMEKWQSTNQNSNSIIHEIAQNGCWDFLEAMSPEEHTEFIATYF
jgi:hypothetical protein